ncbi:hypothetical protein Tco_1123820 [Tanacetum coccineum]|uniref:Uncharacterized protein n=1 Tax=Tanacetum coccineum TaxID=301880 RepID=A0ABQ5J5W8_9ASTR
MTSLHPHMLAICSEDEPMEFKAPKTSLKADKKVTQETQSSSAKDLNLSLLPTSTPVVAGMHKKGAKSIEKEIEYAEEEFNTFPDLSSSDDAKKEIKLEDLSKLMQNVDVDFMDLDSLEDDQPHIVQEHDEEKVTAEKIVLKSKSLPTELKELPSKFNDLSREIKELKKYVEKLEVEILGDLKEIPSKLEKFTSTVSSLTTQVAELKTLQWELPAKFLSIQGQVSSIQAKSPFLFSSPKIPPQPEGELIKKDKEGEHMHLTAHQIKEQKRLYETTKVEMAKKQEEVVKEELIDLLFFEVVTSYYIAELQSTKKFKLSVQYADHPARTMLNEPCLEIFFRLHQGPGIDDHVRTFSSFLLAEVDKRNLNPLKQMRAIEHMRQ